MAPQKRRRGGPGLWLFLQLVILLGLRLDLQAAAAPVKDLYYFVIDKSGSIKTGNLVNPIRGAVVDFVGRLPPQTSVKLVFFNQASTRPESWDSMDLSSKGAFAQHFLERFVPAGETRLYDTVGEVFGRIGAELGRYRQVHVIILSDGKDTDSKKYRSWAELEQLMEQLKLKQKDSFFSWYSLGKEEIADVPKTGTIQYHRVPDASGLKFGLPPPSAEFSASPSKIKTGEPVLFVLENEASVTNVSWSFGDGKTATEFKPRHSFDREGTFDVQVIVAGPGGSSTNRRAGLVAVLKDPPLEARFKWSPRIGRVGERLQLIDESSGSATAWAWRIPRSSLIAERSPEIVAERSGRMEITLEVQRGGQKAVATNFVEILAQPPTAAFTLQSAQVQVGETVVLRATQTDGSWQHEWVIDSETTLTGPEARWKTDRPGRFDVLHRVRGPGGLTEKEAVLLVGDPLVANFSWFPMVVRLGQELQLNDSSIGAPQTWSWSVGALGNFSNRAVTVKPTAAGPLSVTLEIQRDARKASTNRTIVVLEPLPPEPLAANFSWFPDVVRVGQDLRLNDESVGAPQSWSWSIGALGKFTNRAVTVQPTAAGPLSVTLEIQRDGRKASTNRTVVVLGPPPAKPDASFLAEPKLFRRGEIVMLSALQDAPGWSHEWKVASSVRFTGARAVWKADRLGQVLVEHRVTATNGTDLKTEILLGRIELPSAQFSAKPTNGTSPLVVHFASDPAGGTNLVGFLWAFGDGNTSHDRNPDHTYVNNGKAATNFFPTLTVTNNLGEIALSGGKKVITVEPPPLPPPPPPPPPWWRWPLVAIVLILLALWLKPSPAPPMDGAVLTWEVLGKTESRDLKGTKFDLSELGITSIQPGKHVLRVIRSKGCCLIQEGREPICLKHKQQFEAEGTQFTYRE